MPGAYDPGVLYAGLVLALVGFALVTPRGAGSGSVAHRNVRMGSMYFSTRGYSEQRDDADFRRDVWIRVAGLVLLAVGITLIVLGT